jgi:hypothetical protein
MVIGKKAKALPGYNIVIHSNLISADLNPRPLPIQFLSDSDTAVKI